MDTSVIFFVPAAPEEEFCTPLAAKMASGKEVATVFANVLKADRTFPEMLGLVRCGAFYTEQRNRHILAIIHSAALRADNQTRGWKIEDGGLRETVCSGGVPPAGYRSALFLSGRRDAGVTRTGSSIFIDIHTEGH